MQDDTTDQKNYNARNIDKVTAYRRKRYYENRDVFNIKKREYYQKNKERIAAKRKEYYAKNKETIIAYQKEYRRRKLSRLQDLEIIKKPAETGLY